MKHGIPPEAAAAAARGQLIEAIKLTRAATGLGLKEAKDLVDRHVRARGEGWDDDDDAATAGKPLRAHEARPAAPAARASGLAPGEVPRSRLTSGLGLVMAVVAGAVAIYLLVR